MRSLALLLLASAWTAPVVATEAQTYTCPDLAQARQIASCPAESEMRYLFDNKCNDDHYASPALCVDYTAYRAAKNVAMWESQDGEFTGNRSCDVQLRRSQGRLAQRMVVDQRGTLTTLRCEYAGGAVFSLRTRKVCEVQAPATCAPDGACRAVCR